MMRIAIAINIYEESVEQVTMCLEQVRAFLPEADLGVFLNGKVREDLEELWLQHSIVVSYGPNLANNHEWNRWWLRMLVWLERREAHVCFKIDPDTALDRSPSSFPATEYFGDVHWSTVSTGVGIPWFDRPVPFVQGGVVGLAGTTVRRLLSSLILADQNVWQWCPRICPSLPFMEDHLFSAALRELRILPTQWTECKSTWRVPFDNSALRFAFVHPRYVTEAAGR